MEKGYQPAAACPKQYPERPPETSLRMTATTSAPPRGTAALIFVLITVLLDMMALGLVIPVLPPLVVRFMGGDDAKGAEIFALFGFAWALMQFLFAPVLGSLSDRFGRRPVILLSNLRMGLDYVLMALAPNLIWLFIGRLISGITSASFASAFAYVADVTEPERRAKAFGLIGAAFGIGFVLGPAVGGLLGQTDPRLPFWVAAGLSLLNFLYGLVVLPESLARDRRSPFRLQAANPVGALRLIGGAGLTRYAVIRFLGDLAHVVLPSTFVLYASYRYAWGAREVGLMLAAVGFCSLVVQGALVGPIVARLGERRALILGTICGAVGFAIYGLAPSGRLAVPGVMIMAFWGIANPALQALMTRRVEPTEQGKLQGATSSLTGVANLIGPLLFPLFFSWAISGGAGDLPGAPFLLASLLMVGAAMLALRDKGRPSRGEGRDDDEPRRSAPRVRTEADR
jgi:DHA1 family tetracycline resistance protein-like MFS transporter